MSSQTNTCLKIRAINKAFRESEIRKFHDFPPEIPIA